MNLIRRHKGLAIIGGLSLVLLIIMFFIFSRMIFSGSNSEYGDRLNGIVKIDKKDTDKLIEETKALDEVEDVTIRTQGKIIYTIITFTENTSKDKAKKIASDTLKYYDEDVVKCYDFEYFLTQNIEVSEDEEDKSYTIAGNKHPDKDDISWTNN